jgi:hypothetical protein
MRRRCRKTGLAIPECSCRECCLRQIRRHAPWLVDERRRPAKPEPSHERGAEPGVKIAA